MSATDSTATQDPPVTPTLLADRAYVALRDRIVTLQIKPGQPIDEDRVGSELGMGRTPVREAIKRLALERLVTVFPRRGTFASDINITDLAQISDVRVTVESHAARRAAQRIAPAQREELAGLLVELAGVTPGADDRELMDLDARVHRFVYRCADNPYLDETCGNYFNLSLRIWHLAVDRMPGLPARVDEHRALLEAIAAGDGDRAAEILGGHVRSFEDSVRAVL